MNLGSINENDFKESKAVAIAKNIIEENRCFKTFFCDFCVWSSACSDYRYSFFTADPQIL